MALQTGLVACPRFSVRGLVTVVAAERSGRGLMRQAAMAVLAQCMTGSRSGVGDLHGMTPFTHFLPGTLQHERVGHMACDAGRAAVKRAIRARLLVTAAAASNLGVRSASGVWIVTTDAPSWFAASRVIGMNGCVTARAGLFSRRAHRMRRVAARTSVVRGDAAAAQHVHSLVTRPAVRGLLLVEVVWPVTADAFLVPVGEQRRCGDQRLFFAVTALARAHRVACRRMQVLMACGAHLDGRLALSSVGRGDFLVAFDARARCRLLVVVRTMTLRAFARPMHGHGRRSALLARVTTRAFTRLEDVERPAVRVRRPRSALAVHGHRASVPWRAAISGRIRRIERKCMASRAVRFGRRAEPLARLLRRVRDARLFFMTAGAPARAHATHRVTCQLMTLGAGNAFLHDVPVVTDDRACRAPRERYVNPAPGWATRVFRGVRARGSHSDQQCNHEPERAQCVIGVQKAPPHP